jgi:hypothetical protein
LSTEGRRPDYRSALRPKRAEPGCDSEMAP